MIFLLCELMVDLIFILLCSKFCGIFGLEESLPNRLRYVPIFGIRFYQEVDIIKLCFYFSVQLAQGQICLGKFIKIRCKVEVS